MKTLTEEEVQANEALVRKLIGKNVGEPRRSLVLKMLDCPVGEEYFMAPGSSKTAFHDCFVGGLCYHSLNVLKNLRTLTTAMCPGTFDDETLVIAGLFHDLGKAGDGVEPYYVPEESQWHREKLGRLFSVNQRCVQMPTSERGLYVLQLHGVQLTSDEYLAIRLNDGLYDETNRSYRMLEPDLALLVHWADRWSVAREKSSPGTKEG